MELWSPTTYKDVFAGGVCCMEKTRSLSCSVPIGSHGNYSSKLALTSWTSVGFVSLFCMSSHYHTKGAILSL